MQATPRLSDAGGRGAPGVPGAPLAPGAVTHAELGSAAGPARSYRR